MTELTRRHLLGRGTVAAAAIAAGSPLWRASESGADLLARRAVRVPPRGVHLSFTGDTASTTTATWFTDGSADPGTLVEWGPAPAGMTKRELSRAPFERIDGGTAGPTPGVDVLTHRATLDGLAAGERVRYRVGRPGAWSPVGTFTPAPAEPRFTIAHLGDHGMTADSAATLAFLRQRSPDLVLIAGDLSYADGQQAKWDTWFDALQPLAARTPVMAAPGNHENKDFGGEAFKTRLSHPGAGSFYAFDYANIAIVVSTAGVFLEDGTIAHELVELERTLASAAARRAAGEIDFIAVMQHYPLWTNHESRGPLNPTLVLAEEHILQRHQVDLLLVGHDHFYERSAPMAYGQVVNTAGLGRTGYVQVISGGGGKSLYDFVPEGTLQSWSAAHARRYHVVLYEVDGRRLTATAYATDVPGGRAIDSFTLAARPQTLLAPRTARSRTAIATDLLPLAGSSDPRARVCNLEIAGAAGD